jgi:hypothetical protein
MHSSAHFLEINADDMMPNLFPVPPFPFETSTSPRFDIDSAPFRPDFAPGPSFLDHNRRGGFGVGRGGFGIGRGGFGVGRGGFSAGQDRSFPAERGSPSEISQHSDQNPTRFAPVLSLRVQFCHFNSIYITSLFQASFKSPLRN